MKRLLLAVVMGFCVPFLYVLITGPLSVYVSDERLKYLLWIPVGWPSLICRYFFTPFLNSESTSIATIFSVIGNVVAYGLFFYFLLLWRSFRNASVHIEPPPPPKLRSDGS